MVDKKGDRLLITVVHGDLDSAAEIYWGRPTEDFPSPGELNSIQLQADGSLTWKGWTDNDVPIVVHIEGNRVRVTETEDQPPFYGGSPGELPKVWLDTAQFVYENDVTQLRS